MRVLGIESSCDETAAAVVTDAGEVLADVVASQVAMHGPYGGIVPELASRAHMQAIIPVIREALAKAPGGLEGVDAIAVTQGPGLVGSLLVGVQVAKALAWSIGKPLVGVNHLDGHLLAVYLTRPGEDQPRQGPAMPFVGLLVSGGHTALYRVEGFGDIALLAQTRDDAAGEAFDKAAKLLGLGYPGGPAIDRLAAGGNAGVISFPLPMASRKTLEFSFSGLKTALARHVQQHGVPCRRARARRPLRLFSSCDRREPRSEGYSRLQARKARPSGHQRRRCSESRTACPRQGGLRRERGRAFRSPSRLLYRQRGDDRDGCSTPPDGRRAGRLVVCRLLTRPRSTPRQVSPRWNARRAHIGGPCLRARRSRSNRTTSKWPFRFHFESCLPTTCRADCGARCSRGAASPFRLVVGS